MKKLILCLITATQLAGATVASEGGHIGNTPPSEAPVSVRLAKYTQDEPADERLYTNNQISVSSIFPNPASSFAYIDYQFHSDLRNLREAKIVLCTVVGTVVGEYRLSRDARRLNIATQTLSSGVYFYTLALDGKNIVTKKLIIRHPS